MQKSAMLSSAKFQSTLPRRDRRSMSRRLRNGSEISIHAPAKGATVKPPGRARLDQFQSTLPRRERLISWISVSRSVLHFNPRSREGSDVSRWCCILLRERFQSTLPRRERHGIMELTTVPNDFNPRSREGSDGEAQQSHHAHVYFNPRSREGSDARRYLPVLRQ